MKHYKQLTYEQRCQIEVLKKSGFTQVEIRATVGVSQSTISRELARNTGLRGYRHKQAQKTAMARRESARRAAKMTLELALLINQKLAEKWSLEQISGWLLKEHRILLSHERIYQHVWSDKAEDGELYRNLRRHGRKYPKRSNGKTNRGQIKDRISIDDRSAVVDA